jgi:hypothetical protein
VRKRGPASPRPARRRRVILGAALGVLLAGGCAPGAGFQQLSRSGRHAGHSALGTLLQLATPGLAVPCEGRAGARGFKELRAEACLQRLAGDYAHGVDRGLGRH